MKLQLLTLTTLLTISASQNLSGELPCATACLSSAISKAGCAETDVGCQCGPTQASIAAIVAPCLLTACAATQLPAVQSIGLALCAEYSAALTKATTSVTATTKASTVASSSTPTSSHVPIVNSTVKSTTTTSKVSSSATVALSSVSAASHASTTTSAPATASSSAAMTLLVSGISGLAALFFGVAATL